MRHRPAVPEEGAHLPCPHPKDSTTRVTPSIAAPPYPHTRRPVALFDRVRVVLGRDLRPPGRAAHFPPMSRPYPTA